MTPLYRYEKVRRAEAASNICAQFCIDMIAAVPSREAEMRQWLAEEGRRMARAWGIVRAACLREAVRLADHQSCSYRGAAPLRKTIDELERQARGAAVRQERWQRIEWEAIKCT